MASRLRFDCAMKIALIAILSKIKIMASTAITAAMTRSLSETVLSRFIRATAGASPVRSRRRSKQISPSPYGVDQPGAAASLQLAPQGRDVHLDDVLIEAVVAPDCGQDLGLAHHSVPLGGKVTQEAPFSLGQIEGVVATSYQRGIVVDHQVVHGDRAAAGPGAPEHRVDPCHQLYHRKGLDQVVVGACG